MIYEIEFIKSLLMTVAAEVLVAIILRRWLPKALGLSVSYGKLIVIVAVASIITLPYVWFILPIILKTRIQYVIIAELLVWIAEAVWYKAILKLNIKQALILSLAANGFSYLIGVLV